MYLTSGTCAEPWELPDALYEVTQPVAAAGLPTLTLEGQPYQPFNFDADSVENRVLAITARLPSTEVPGALGRGAAAGGGWVWFGTLNGQRGWLAMAAGEGRAADPIKQLDWKRYIWYNVNYTWDNPLPPAHHNLDDDEWETFRGEMATPGCEYDAHGNPVAGGRRLVRSLSEPYGMGQEMGQEVGNVKALVFEMEHRLLRR
jgi:hypothetical protein